MKEVSKINVKCASGWLKDEISLIKELCEIKDVLDTTRCVHLDLDSLLLRAEYVFILHLNKDN